jgi:iron complex outermembrane recepter protein
VRGKGACVKGGDGLRGRGAIRMRAVVRIRPSRCRLYAPALLACLLAFWAGAARPETALSVDIAAGPVADALTEFARQTGLQLVYVSEIAAGRTSGGARAGASPSDALTQLLAGTGLAFAFVNERTVRIYLAATAEPPPPTAVPVAPHARTDQKEILPPALIDEVVVLGARGQERVSDAPMSIAVWTADAMAMSGAKSLEGIAALTPGVNYDVDTSVGAGISTSLSIRGVSDPGGRSTTRVFVDAAPVHSLQSDFGEVRPLLFDVQRVEILRGPQGALLGEGTEGGAVRYLYNQPSLSEFSGQVHAEAAHSAFGSPSYEAGAATGGPIIRDVVGFRLSAWYRRDGGFIEHVDPFTDAVLDANSNWSVSKSARLALTFAPSDDLRVTPSVSYQSIDLNDSPIFYVNISDLDTGELRNGKLLRQPDQDSYWLGVLNITWERPFAHLTSVASYFRRSATSLVDYTNSYPNYFQGEFGPLPVYPLGYENAAGFTHDLIVDSITEDLRLRSVDPDARFTWMAGTFYSNVRQQDLQTLVNKAVYFGETDPQFNLGATINSRITNSEFAMFGEADYRLSERLRANAGLRVTFADSRQTKSYSGLTTPVPAETAPAQNGTPLAPRVGLSYERDAHSLYFATLAKGYRNAGIDAPSPFPCTTDVSVPFPADSVWSIEAGGKNVLESGRIQLDLSAYYMRWQNLHQLFFTRTNCAQVANEDSATGAGFDLAMQAAVTDHLRAELAVSFIDAHYSQTTFLSGAGSSGQDYFVVSSGDSLGTLPQVPAPWSATGSLAYETQLGHGLTATLQLQDVFHSHNPGPFSTRPIAEGCCRQGPPYLAPPWAWSVTAYPSADPATNVVNVRARIRRAGAELSLYVNNALNSHPLLLAKTEGSSYGVVFGPPLVYGTTLIPRTTGLAFGLQF